jgi:hypothetical protein
MLPASFHDQVAYTEVQAATWRLVFDTAGELARLNGMEITPDLLLQSLTSEAPGKELLDALEVIVELGTETGRELLQQAAADGQIPLGAIDDTPAREFAARTWIESRTNALTANVLVRARANSAEVAQTRPCREFAGKCATPGAIDPVELKRAITKWCEENKKNQAITVFSYQRNGECWYEVLRGDPLKRVVEIRDGRPGILDYRPAASDLLRYDPATGRLAISTRSPLLLRMYRQAAGSLLLGDAGFFASENVCTLKPLQVLGRALFEQHRPPGILRVDVIELRWRRGDRDKILVQGRDCFLIIEEFGVRRSEGELIEARLSIAFAGSTRRGSVSIKVPNRIDIKAGAHEHTVERMLSEAGIRGHFDETVNPPTLWSMYPWRESEATWRRCVGLDFDSLLTQKMFRSVDLHSATSPDHPAARSALTVEVVDATTYVGVSEDPAIGLRTLTASDVKGYAFDVVPLMEKLHSDLVLQAQGGEIDSGIWRLGHRVLSASVTLDVFLALREPSAETAKLIRAATATTHVVLIVPHGCDCTLDIPHVAAHLHGGSYGDLLATIVTRLGLQNEVSPVLWAPEELILDTVRGQAWYRRVELTTLQPHSHAFSFAVMVARARGLLVKTHDLNDRLSASRKDSEAAKTAKTDFLKSIKTSFKAKGLDYPPEVSAIFASPNGGYRLVASARVLP